MTIGVYALLFPNNDNYIGSSVKSCEGRHRDHTRSLRKGCHENQHLQNLFNKYGEPEFHILQECGDPKGMRIKEIIIRIREQSWINAYGIYAINKVPAYPSSMYGKIVSKETRNRMSESRMGRPATMKGKHHTEEAKRKISEASKGRTCSEETRNKMREARKGMELSEEHKRKIGEAGTRRHHSEETKHKISKANRGKHHYTAETKLKILESRKEHIRCKEARKRMHEEARKKWACGMEPLTYTFEII